MGRILLWTFAPRTTWKEELHLLDDNMSGFLEAYLNSQEAGLDLTFGLRLRILDDCEDKSEDVTSEGPVNI